MASYTITLNFSDAETPRRANNQLVLQHAPSPAESLQFFRNGLLQLAGTDYIQSGFFIVPNMPADVDDVFLAYYRW